MMHKSTLTLCKDLRHSLHEHPELAWQEHWTKATLINFLKEHTRLEIVDKDYYFYAMYQGAGDDPAIAFRADFDALPIEDSIDQPYASKVPGKGHKCGHDGHAATLCGLAMEVDRCQPARNVVFLFQPAEEVGEGAKACLSVFDEVEIGEFYAYHNYPGQAFGTVAIKPDTLALTSKGMNLYFTGKKSHAMRPEDGINPSFTIASVVDFIRELQIDSSRFKGFTRITLVEMQVGSNNFGISAGDGVIRLTIRAYYDEDLLALENTIVDYSQMRADQSQVSFEHDSVEYFPALVNHLESVHKVWQACQSIGQAVQDLEEPFRASEDFAYFLQRVPGAMFFVGDGEDYPPLHTVEFDFPDALIEVAGDVFYALIEA